jgi:hypothetical protein
MAGSRVWRCAAAIGSAGVLLLTAGCTGGPTGKDEPPSASAPASTPSGTPVPVATECLEGEWSADLDDLIGQLADQLSSTGLTVTRADASGTQTLAIGREGVLGFDADMTFTLSADMGNGMVMTMTQVHSGQLQASWEWEGTTTDSGGTIRFSDFEDSGYDVKTTVDINGRTADSPIEPPSIAAADVPTVVTCEGDTLTTQPQGTPFTTTWTRTG